MSTLWSSKVSSASLGTVMIFDAHSPRLTCPGQLEWPCDIVSVFTRPLMSLRWSSRRDSTVKNHLVLIPESSGSCVSSSTRKDGRHNVVNLCDCALRYDRPLLLVHWDRLSVTQGARTLAL